MTSVSEVDWKIEPRRLRSRAQPHRVRDVAVMGDREAAAWRGRRTAAGRCAAPSRRWSNSGHGRSPRGRPARGSRSSLSKLPATWPMPRWLWKALPSKLVMPAASWPRCWSAWRPSATIAAAAVSRAPDAEHAALLAQLVVVEGMGGQHHGSSSPAWRAYRHADRLCRPREEFTILAATAWEELDVNVKRETNRRMPQTALHSDYRQPRQAARTYTITQLCDEFGVTARALRFYEDEGLISPQRQGLSRIYSAGATAPGSPGSCAASGSASASPRSAR